MMMIDTYLKVGYMMIKINTNFKEMYMFYSGICGDVSDFSKDKSFKEMCIIMIKININSKRGVLL